MKRRIIQKLLGLYPTKWRNEYGAEFEDLLFAQPLAPAVVLNVIAGALQEQVRISNHPATTVRYLALMTGVLRLFFAVGALSCGVRAMGYWAILQFGHLPPAESSGIALVVRRSAFLFVILSLASAYLRERTSGARAIAVKALYLTGAYGLPPIALFAVASGGAVLRMPEVMGLLILFVSFVLVFRPPIPKHTE